MKLTRHTENARKKVNGGVPPVIESLPQKNETGEKSRKHRQMFTGKATTSANSPDLALNALPRHAPS